MDVNSLGDCKELQTDLDAWSWRVEPLPCLATNVQGLATNFEVHGYDV